MALIIAEGALIATYVSRAIVNDAILLVLSILVIDPTEYTCRITETML